MILKKKSDEELRGATTNLNLEQKKLESISNDLISSLNTAENTSVLRDSLSEIEQSKKLINSGNITEASKLIDLSIDKLKNLLSKFENFSEKNEIEEISQSNKKIRNLQELYAGSLSKNQSIKSDAIKRKERTTNIDSEIDRWQNLNSNSEKNVE